MASILHFPRPTGRRRLRVADVTYGQGIFWKQIDTTEFDFFPSDLYTHKNSYDFRDLPYENDFLDVGIIDVPWGCHHAFDSKNSYERDRADRYGTTKLKSTSAHHVMELYRGGLTELHRVLRPGGIMLVKCQDIFHSGKQFRLTEMVRRWAVDSLGMEDVDKFYLFRSCWRPALHHGQQRTARRVVSVMWIFQKRNNDHGDVPASESRRPPGQLSGRAEHTRRNSGELAIA